MFGYVKPVQSELLVKEYDFYRATYCGICKGMKKHTGVLSNITLSYDSVLLALVRMLFVEDGCISAKMDRCIAHPLKKRCMLVQNPAIEYTARAFAILTHYKLLDDIKDEGVGKKMLVLPLRPIVKGGAKKAGISELEEVISDRLKRINELEERKVSSVDEPAELFGELLGEVFANGISDSGAVVLREFGFHLGKFIYAADAAEDYDEDRKKGRYNPYLLLYDGKPLTEENKKSIKSALIYECRRMEAAVNLMPFGNRYTIENIVKNIIYLGLVKRIEFLEPKEITQTEKEGTQNERSVFSTRSVKRRNR